MPTILGTASRFICMASIWESGFRSIQIMDFMAGIRATAHPGI